MDGQALNSVNKPLRKTHAERTELSDSLMLDACISLIVDQGTENTTLKAVGERAGYSRGLAGARFKSKNGLFCFVIKRVADQWRSEIEALIQHRIGYDAICAAIDAHHEFCLKTPKSFRAFYILWFESIGHDSDISRVIVNIHERRYSDVTRWIELAVEDNQLSANINAASAARYFLTSMSGIIYQWLINPRLEDEISLLHQQLKETMRVMLPVAK
ncbi:MAG: TetR/AcrR family transcriptional regulator [Gammaproteobacteria bacterium]|nr:TetR/AcrR family transcriptional regulator [Gammaproteobacteria bacterium]